MRSTRSVRKAWSAARFSQRGACCAATRGRTEDSIQFDDESDLDDRRVAAHPARARVAARPRLAAHDRRLHVGVVDRRLDGDRADDPRPADREADPFDAEPAASRAADERDSEEVQERQEEAERRADEVLPGEPDQPGCVMSADAAAVPGLHLAVLRAAQLLEEPAVRRSLVAPLHPGHQRAHDVVLGRLRAARRLRRVADGVDALHVGDCGQDAANHLHAYAARLRVRHRTLSRRPRSVLGDDEPLDRRAGIDHAPARAQDAGARSRQAFVADAAEGRRLEWERREAERRCAGAAGACRRAAAAQGAEEEEGRAALSASDLTVEATGETVGEAKWSALRELELRYPALDKAAVRFEVVSEGERGLLGVGYEPARVIAHLPEDAAATFSFDESEQASDARGLVMRILGALGVEAHVDVREDDESVTLTCTGADVALLIGRHGQTIDAVQYLMNALAHRAFGDDRKDVIVDAAGYRERRRLTLESLAVRTAQQVQTSGEAVELEPMTAVERKVVHLKLKEFEGVATTSEGTEPNRYVVVLPD